MDTFATFLGFRIIPILNPFFRIFNSKDLNISIYNTRMNHAAAVGRQPHSPDGVV